MRPEAVMAAIGEQIAGDAVLVADTGLRGSVGGSAR